MTGSQLVGMACYEFMMHWRRRELVVATAVLVGLHLVIMLVLRDAAMQLAAKMNMDVLAVEGTQNIVPFIWISIYLTVIAIFSPIMTEAVPLDRHYNIHELLASLPLSRHIYLLGKLLGVFLAVLASLFIGFALISVMAWLSLGSFNIGEYFKMWLIGVIPLALLNTGLNMLLACSQPTRRRAAAVGGVFAILLFLTFTSSVNVTLYGSASSFFDALNPARPVVLRYFMPVTGDGTVLASSSGISNDVTLTIVMGIVELLVVGVLAWWWMQRHENVI